MIKQILEGDIADMKISSLPTRPTAPTSFGGRGFTSNDMKAAFDRLPLHIVEKVNEIIEAINTTGDGSLASEIYTEIFSGHTLTDLFRDVRSGELAHYLRVGEDSLHSLLTALLYSVEAIKRDMGDGYTASEFVTLDCGSPRERMEGGEEYAE